jgi:hypothetical protein
MSIDVSRERFCPLSSTTCVCVVPTCVVGGSRRLRSPGVIVVLRREGRCLLTNRLVHLCRGARKTGLAARRNMDRRARIWQNVAE